MTYGWEFHHLLNDVAQGKQGATALDAYFARQDSLFGPDDYRMYFTSNHDENSWNGSEFERMGANAQAAYVLAATAVRGMPLLYTGQEASLRRRLQFFQKDTVTWGDTTLVPFYRTLFDLKHREAALANGALGGPQRRLTTDGGERTYAFTRTRGGNTVLVALNFGDAPAALHYRDLSQPGRYTDWFSHAPATLAAQGTIEVPAHGWRVLVR
jgi:glycosidase